MGYRPERHRTVPFPVPSDAADGRPCPSAGGRPRTHVHRREPTRPRAAPRAPRVPRAAASQRPPDPTRADALGRIAAKVSGRRDLTGLFDDIIDEAFALFGVDRAGLWTYDATAERPLSLAAQRGLPPVILDAVTSLRRDAHDGRDGRPPDATGPRPRSDDAGDDRLAA